MSSRCRPQKPSSRCWPSHSADELSGPRGDLISRVASANFQELHYADGVDYRVGSPHLAYWHLYDRLVGVVTRELDRLAAADLPLTVLEVGAGHGGYTGPVLAAGASVTAVEMSEPSVRALRSRFAHNDRLTPVYSPDGSLPADEGQFGLALAVSVLHHIPDYLTFVRELADAVVVGGSLVTLQDPLWYPRRPSVHRIDRASYLAWRIAQGDLWRGLATQLRRTRGAYDESKPGDMVEYHVVRQGVDEQGLGATLSPLFESVEVVGYWSNQLPAGQRLGERLGLHNTFGIVARGRR